MACPKKKPGSQRILFAEVVVLAGDGVLLRNAQSTLVNWTEWTGGLGMVPFRKIIFLIGILLCSVSSYAQASMEIQMVQISDSGAYNLAEKMNAIAQQYHTEHHIDNLQHAGSMPNSPYDMYIASTGPHGHGAVITFYCNKAGYVSKITIMNTWGDTVAAKASANALNLALSALGVNKSEHDVLTGSQLSKTLHSNVWCSRSNRRILLQLMQKKYGNTMAIRLTAYNN